MKYILAILLCISLYTPDIARLVAYADYVVDTMSAQKINICNCQDVLQQKEKPADHNQHMGVINTEWTYTITKTFTIQPATTPDVEQTVADIHTKLPSISLDIFQPPKV